MKQKKPNRQRPLLTATVAPETLTKINREAKEQRRARGQIVDQAVAALP